MGKYSFSLFELAHDREVDADELRKVMDRLGKTDPDLVVDVKKKIKRLSAAEQLAQNEAAKEAFEVASRKVIDAQERLDEAWRRFLPPIDAAVNERAAWELVVLQTANSESVLLETVMDAELLQRESELISERREIQSKLRPLLEDRKHLSDWQRGEHYRNLDLQKKLSGETHDCSKRHFREDIAKSDSHMADLTNQIRQIDDASQPMQKRLAAIENELNEIHVEKLKP